MPSMKTSQTSLSLSQTLGDKIDPTPCGVPVKITSPGINVDPCDKKLTIVATSKTIHIDKIQRFDYY